MKKETFLNDIKDHKMTIIHANGLNRHLRFARPGSGCMHFDLVTYPWYLVFSGDMGCYVFSRLQDMFEFFRTDRWGRDDINPDYWAEKVQAQDMHHPVKIPSREAYARAIRDDVATWLDGRGMSFTFRRDLWQNVKDDVLSVLEYGKHDDWDRAVHEFEWGGFRFVDFWDRSLDEWTYRYLWCCRAIAWGIGIYDKFSEQVAA